MGAKTVTVADLIDYVRRGMRCEATADQLQRFVDRPVEPPKPLTIEERVFTENAIVILRFDDGSVERGPLMIDDRVEAIRRVIREAVAAATAEQKRIITELMELKEKYRLELDAAKSAPPSCGDRCDGFGMCCEGTVHDKLPAATAAAMAEPAAAEPNERLRNAFIEFARWRGAPSDPITPVTLTKIDNLIAMAR